MVIFQPRLIFARVENIRLGTSIKSRFFLVGFFESVPVRRVGKGLTFFVSLTSEINNFRHPRDQSLKMINHVTIP